MLALLLRTRALLVALLFVAAPPSLSPVEFVSKSARSLRKLCACRPFFVASALQEVLKQLWPPFGRDSKLRVDSLRFAVSISRSENIVAGRGCPHTSASRRQSKAAQVRDRQPTSIARILRRYLSQNSPCPASANVPLPRIDFLVDCEYLLLEEERRICSSKGGQTALRRSQRTLHHARRSVHSLTPCMRSNGAGMAARRVARTPSAMSSSSNVRSTTSNITICSEICFDRM